MFRRRRSWTGWRRARNTRATAPAIPGAGRSQGEACLSRCARRRPPSCSIRSRSPRWGKRPATHRRPARTRRRAPEVGKRDRGIAGIWRDDLVGALGSELHREAQARELRAPVRREVPCHHQQPPHRVGGLPALRLHAEHLELNGQNGLCIDVGIHARAISLQALHRVAIEACHDALGHSRDAERSHELVGVEGPPSEEFRQPPCRRGAGTPFATSDPGRAHSPAQTTHPHRSSRRCAGCLPRRGGSRPRRPRPSRLPRLQGAAAIHADRAKPPSR